MYCGQPDDSLGEEGGEVVFSETAEGGVVDHYGGGCGHYAASGADHFRGYEADTLAGDGHVFVGGWEEVLGGGGQGDVERGLGGEEEHPWSCGDQGDA